MDQVPAVPEHGRLAENNVLGTRLELFFHPFEALEEHQVDGAGTVGELSDQPQRTPLPHLFDACQSAAELDPGGGRIDFPHAVETGAVDVAERECVKQIPERTDPQFLVQKIGAPRPDSGQILDVAVQDLCHTQI